MYFTTLNVKSSSKKNIKELEQTAKDERYVFSTHT